MLLTESGLHMESARSKYGRPASGSPVQTSELLATGRPRSSTGTFSCMRSEAQINVPLQVERRFGHEVSPAFQQPANISLGTSPSASTTEVSGCSFTSNSVTTPKFPPPPRKAQNKSGFSFELARTTEPSAVTSVNPSTLSHDNPNRRVSHPVPPPRISPEAPV